MQHPKEKPTEELEEEQRQLAILKRQATLSKHPYWEWDSQTGEFTTQNKWAELVGPLDQPFVVFPNRKPGEAITHEDLVALIERWTATLAEDEQVEAGDRASEFLLKRPISKDFQHKTKMLRTDGLAIPIEIQAKSVWADGQLKSIFCETRDLSAKYQGKQEAAIAIADQADKLKGLKAKVERSLLGANAFVKALPLIGAALVLGVDFLEAGLEQLGRARTLILTPTHTAKSPQLYGDNDFLPPWVTRETMLKAQTAITPHRIYGEVTVWAYVPGNFPQTFAPLVRASKEEIVRFGEGTSAYATDSDQTVAEMAANHTTGQSFEVDNSEGFLYSMPFEITRFDIVTSIDEDDEPTYSTQTFFIEIVSDGQYSKDEVKRSADQAKDELIKIFER